MIKEEVKSIGENGKNSQRLFFEFIEFSERRRWIDSTGTNRHGELNQSKIKFCVPFFLMIVLFALVPYCKNCDRHMQRIQPVMDRLRR